MDQPNRESPGTSRRTFLGVPVEGDVATGHPRPVQRPLADLEPLLRAILADDVIVAFGWVQYTPYFNDGERCVFSVYEPWFITTADDEGEDDDVTDEFSLSYHPTLAPKRWDEEAGNFVRVERDTDTVNRFTRCEAVADALGSGVFDDALIDAFGDHAHVRINRSGIVLDSYEHE